jgi:hypothetical protein
MPSSRIADYYLGYMDGCVYLDFNKDKEDRIYLRRISFDRYGCCNLDSDRKSLNKEDSAIFKDLMTNNLNDQILLLEIVKKAIDINRTLIWQDALEEYHLI